MKKRYLFLLLLLFLFIPRVNALTSCTQGRYTDNKTLPLILFIGNGPSSGYEIQYYAFADTDNAPLQWSYNSFQQLCAIGTGTIPTSFNYMTFRVTNYLYKKGHIYSIIFSFTDSDPVWNIQPDSAVSSNFNWYKIISSKSDPRDKVMYLTVTFESLQDYSGTANFVFYTSSINTNNFLANTSFMYSPYILDLGYDTESDLSSIKSTQNNVLSSVQSVQSELNGVKEEQAKTTNAVKDVDNTLKDDNVDVEENGSFFSDFDTEDNGSISSIISAPLVAIQAMLNNQCSPLTATYKGKELSLPCGTSFWAGLGDIKTFLNVAIGGLLCYRIIVKLFKLIEGFKDPENDKVEVMNL